MACNAAITEKQIRLQVQREEVRRLIPTSGLKSSPQLNRQDRSFLSDYDSSTDNITTNVDKAVIGIDKSDNNCTLIYGGVSAVKYVSTEEAKSVHNLPAHDHKTQKSCEDRESVGKSSEYMEEVKTSACAGSSSSAKRSPRHSTLSHCFGDESSIEDREISSSLHLDEESITRHMCTANIPGESVFCIYGYLRKYLSGRLSDGS